jgi:hypothetical protein
MTVPRKIQEEHLDSVLKVLFLARYADEFMIIYVDGDLGRFGDSELMRGKPYYDKRLKWEESFCPDAIALSRDGRVFIVEAKVRRVTGQKCYDLVVQTLDYASRILSPTIGGYEFEPLEFVRALWTAHHGTAIQWVWPMRPFVPLEKAYVQYFNRKTGLVRRKIADESPGVLFLLPEAHLGTLVNVCNKVREHQEFESFSRYVKSRLSDDGRKRLPRLEANWPVLRRAKFYSMSLDQRGLVSALGTKNPICDRP